MTTLFVSDLHLSAARPDKLELFLALLARARERARALYILGDLFEVWLGDDDDTPPHPRVIAALAALSAAGVALAVMRGNRDFLFGRRFAEATGARLLPDYTVIDLAGERALLTHGDLLCTRDVEYQRFRRVVRNPLVQAAFLALPLAARRRIALRTQAGTQASMQSKPEAIMDVEHSAVEAAVAEHAVSVLIHGHTHRPGAHRCGSAGRRYVLGDWYEGDGVLVAEGSDLRAWRVAEWLAA